jgi:hypothetical protein
MIPSRHDNPFSSCWTQPKNQAYQFPAGKSVDLLISHLENQGWWGQVLGPHGIGKSTLLTTLAWELNRRGYDIKTHPLRATGRPHRLEFADSPTARHKTIVLVDGYEQLHPWSAWWLRTRCRWTGAGLLVTTHRPCSLPVLARLLPDLEIVQRLVAKLSQHTRTSVTRSVVKASYLAHRGNVREILFDLYDRHERYRRGI